MSERRLYYLLLVKFGEPTSAPNDNDWVWLVDEEMVSFGKTVTLTSKGEDFLIGLSSALRRYS